MLKRTWLSRFQLLLGGFAVSLFFSSISHAQQWLDVSVNEFDFNGEPYTFVKIEVNPEILNNKVFNDDFDRLNYIQETQERLELIEDLLHETQDFIAENYRLHGQVGVNGQIHDIAYGAAYKYPDATGTHEIMVRAGNVRPKTKTDDFLQRKSVTVNLIRGHSLFTDLQTPGTVRRKFVATIKAVETEPIRVFKDFASLIPLPGFNAVFGSPVQSGVVELEFENLSVAPTPEGATVYEYVPFLLNGLLSSTLVAEPVRAGRRVRVRIGSMRQGTLHYSAWGFERYGGRAASRTAPGMDYLAADAPDLKTNLQKFYSVTTEAEFFALPSVQKLRDRYSHEELEEVAKIVVKKSLKPRFDPDPMIMILMGLDCKAPLHDQSRYPITF